MVRLGFDSASPRVLAVRFFSYQHKKSLSDVLMCPGHPVRFAGYIYCHLHIPQSCSLRWKIWPREQLMKSSVAATT